MACMVALRRTRRHGAFTPRRLGAATGVGSFNSRDAANVFPPVSTAGPGGAAAMGGYHPIGAHGNFTHNSPLNEEQHSGLHSALVAGNAGSSLWGPDTLRK